MYVVTEMASDSFITFSALEIAFEFLVVPSEKVQCSWLQRKGIFFYTPLKWQLWALFSADMSFANQTVAVLRGQGWGWLEVTHNLCKPGA